MHQFHAMNTSMYTVGLSKHQQIEVEKWFAYIENKLSRFRETSELNQLNQAQGKPFFMSPLMNAVVKESLHFYHETNGIFHPFLGRILANLGYHQSFELFSTSSQPHSIYTQPNQPHFDYSPRMKEITIHPPVEIDLGGIAKAWSASYLSKKLHQAGVRRGVINAGGDVVVWNEKTDPFIFIQIAHPHQVDTDLLSIGSTQSFSVATSSSEKRQWQNKQGKRMHHLIDARTNLPCESNLVQISVTGPELTVCEVYAKCLLILGEEQGIPWITEKRPEYAVIALRKDGSLLFSGPIDSYVMKGV